MGKSRGWEMDGKADGLQKINYSALQHFAPDTSVWTQNTTRVPLQQAKSNRLQLPVHNTDTPFVPALP
jgi:hypothetical protein